MRPLRVAAQGQSRLPANVPGRTDVIGFLSRDHETYLHAVDGSVMHQEIITAMNGFVCSRNFEKLAIVVMDNASGHRKAMAEAGREWLGQRVWAWFLLAYLPALNLIEILWKKIKYEWLLWIAYQCFETMRVALDEIFENLGDNTWLILHRHLFIHLQKFSKCG